MSVLATLVEMAEAGLARVPRVELFSVGTHRGREFTDQDLDAMVGNFTLNYPALEPTAVLGHEEDQRWLDDTGIPAAGYVDKVWREGPLLCCSLKDVPAVIASAVNTRRYKTVSAEVYDDPPEGCEGAGCTLRRVALLGGDLPQLKQLAKLPAAVYAERSDEVPRRGRGRKWLTFAEAVPMDREQMLALVAQSGITFTPEFLDSLSDDQLGMLIASLTPPAPETPAEEMPAETPPPDMAAAEVAVPAVPQAAPAGQQPAKVILQYNEQSRRYAAAAKASQDATNRMLHQVKRQQVSQFCERMVAAGKVLPAQRPHVEARLLRADCVRVRKFGEKQVTELDLQMQEIEAGPVLSRFTERVAQPLHGNGQGGAISDARRRELLAASGHGKAILARLGNGRN